MERDMKEFLTEVKGVWHGLPDILTHLLFALIILAAGIVIIKLGRKLINKLFARYSEKHETGTRADTLHTLTKSLFNALMYVAVSLTCLSALGVNVSSILALAGFGGVALGFGCQTLVKDLVSGMFLWFEGRCQVGDVVTVAGQTGRIESVALRTTTLRATNGNLYVIPNGEIRTVVNMSSEYRNAIVDVTIAHGQDYTAALEILREAMKDLNERLDYIKEDPVVQGYVSMDPGRATVRIECRCEVCRCWELEREIRLAVLETMRAKGLKP